jgi:RNA polymerase sigma-70 factor (ECF subfamily)
MSAIAEGDQMAFNLLTSRHLKMVYAIALQRLKHPSDAEEVAQDVFTRLWKNAPKWEAEAKVSTWLYRVCVNRSIDMLRRRKPMTDIDDVPEIPDGADNALQTLETKDRKRQIEEALGNLKSEQREAIQLVYFFEMRQQEAADSLGLSLAAFESLLRRARKKLHTVLNKNYEELY